MHKWLSSNLKKKSAKNGQAIVEFALIFTALMVLLLGMIDVGRLYMTMLALDSAAAEGASYAALRPQDPDIAETRAMNEGAGSQMLATGLISADVTQPPTLSAGQAISCTVTYDFTPLFPVISELSFDISRTAVSTIMQ